jgi:hypothetical protein
MCDESIGQLLQVDKLRPFGGKKSVSHLTRELFFLILSDRHLQSPIELRIGINPGDVIVEADDVHSVARSNALDLRAQRIRAGRKNSPWREVDESARPSMVFRLVHPSGIPALRRPAR